MAYSDILLCASHAVNCASYMYQVRMFKVRKLVWGWSQDLSVIGAFAVVLSAISSLTYLLSTRITIQCALRSPVYPQAPISILILFVESIGSVVSLVVCFFALFTYTQTRNEYQGVSGTFLLLTATVGVACIWATREYCHGLFSSLDLLEGVWLLSKCASVASPWPQLVIQSFSELCAGTHKRTRDMQLLSTILLVAGKCVSRFEYSWFDVPFNFCTWMECGSRLLAALVLTIEVSIYKAGHAPLDSLKLEGEKDD